MIFDSENMTVTPV